MPLQTAPGALVRFNLRGTRGGILTPNIRFRRPAFYTLNYAGKSGFLRRNNCNTRRTKASVDFAS